jgi:hypothetical protein
MRISIFIFTIFTVLSAYSQKTSIEATKSNFLFPEIDNPITVIVENVPCDQLILETDNGVITRSKGCNFSIAPKLIGESNISIVRKSNKK